MVKLLFSYVKTFEILIMFQKIKKSVKKVGKSVEKGVKDVKDNVVPPLVAGVSLPFNLCSFRALNFTLYWFFIMIFFKLQAIIGTVG